MVFMMFIMVVRILMAPVREVNEGSVGVEVGSGGSGRGHGCKVRVDGEHFNSGHIPQTLSTGGWYNNRCHTAIGDFSVRAKDK